MKNIDIDKIKPLREKPFEKFIPGASIIDNEELKQLEDVIREKTPFRHYGIGTPSKVKTFEDECIKFLGAKYALAVSSGSAAIFGAVAALGLKPGDEVIIPGFGWFSDYYAIAFTGALPVVCDIDDTLNIDPVDFERKITNRTKAVIAIHYQGGPADMDAVIKIAERHNIKVIEDCAQSFGAEYKGRKLGTIGDVGITSFQGNKTITCGEGGLIYTNDEKIFANCVRWHDLGFFRNQFKERLEDKTLADDDYSFFGNQARMSELQGAFILAQLRKLPGMISDLRKKHNKIKEYFKDDKRISFRKTFEGNSGLTLFLRFKTKEERDLFKQVVEKLGIKTGASSGCTNLLNRLPVKNNKMMNDSFPPFGKGYIGEDVKYENKTCCPNTDKLYDCHLPLGIGPLYTDKDIDDIITGIKTALDIMF